MNMAEKREVILDAIIQKYSQTGVDPVKSEYVLLIDVIMILRHDDPNGLSARFFNTASDNQWTLLQREFRIWQKNGAHAFNPQGGTSCSYMPIIRMGQRKEEYESF